MSVESIWAHKHRIMRHREDEPPEVIAMCKNSSIAAMLAFSWNLERQREKLKSQPTVAS